MHDDLLDQPVPPLTPSRVVVRPFVDADLADFLAYQGLPAVRRYQPGTPMSESEAAAFVAEQGRQRPDARGAWHGRVIELVAERRVIGDLGVWIPVELDDPAVGDLGVQVDPRYQGLGYAREAVKTFIGTARREFALDRLTASCDEANVASAALLERLGMRLLNRAHGSRQYGLALR